MQKHQDSVREEIKRLLTEGIVGTFIAYERGFDPLRPAPLFARTAAEAERVVVNSFCANNFAKYALRFRHEDKPVGILVKGCDARGIERLVRDYRIKRERVRLIGVPCTGVVDARKVAELHLGTVGAIREEGEEVILHTEAGERRLPKREYLAAKCLTCDAKNPSGVDTLIGEPVDDTPCASRDYLAVKELEGKTPEARTAYWEEQFSRCIRCYACRNACPACNCEVCVFDVEEPRWVSKGNGPADREMFHFIRATHVAGRCIDCHECERVCPMEIPLMLLNHKLMKDIGGMFEVGSPHVPAEIEPLGQFLTGDPDEFN